MKREMRASELAQTLETQALPIVDVRTPLEFRTGHLPGAVNVPLGSKSQLEGIQPNDAFVVVCHSGARSAMACQSLRVNYPNAINLIGGTAAWQAAGLPLERSSAAGSVISVDRQAHLVAGLMLVIALVLGTNLNSGWFYLAALPAFGLTLDAVTGICPMRFLLKLLPWNRRPAGAESAPA